MVDMIHTDGWKIIKRTIDQACEAIRDSLSVVEEQKDILRLQERYRSLKTLVELVETHHSLLEYSRMDLQDLKNEQAFNDEFALNE